MSVEGDNTSHELSIQELLELILKQLTLQSEILKIIADIDLTIDEVD